MVTFWNFGDRELFMPTLKIQLCYLCRIVKLHSHILSHFKIEDHVKSHSL